MPWIRDAAPSDPGCERVSFAVSSAESPPIVVECDTVQIDRLLPLECPNVGLLPRQVAIVADLGLQLAQSTGW